MYLLLSICFIIYNLPDVTGEDLGYKLVGNKCDTDADMLELYPKAFKEYDFFEVAICKKRPPSNFLYCGTPTEKYKPDRIPCRLMFFGPYGNDVVTLRAYYYDATQALCDAWIKFSFVTSSNTFTPFVPKTKSSEFTRSKMFTGSNVYTKSRIFTGSNAYTKSKSFTGTRRTP